MYIIDQYNYIDIVNVKINEDLYNFELKYFKNPEQEKKSIHN